MKQLRIKTSKKDQIIDITERVQEALSQTKKREGICVVFAAHTTCCITTADLDPGTDQDLLDALRKILPEKMKYRHPHDPSHAPDHILSSIIGPSVTIPFTNGDLQLGTWQRIILVELDGPRERNISITLLGDL